MGRPRKNIEIGKEYGWLTVLSEAPKSESGHIRWNVRCRCGDENMVQTGFLAKPNCKCRKCSNIYDRQHRRLSQVGEILNGWRLLEEVGKTQNGAILYRCECIYCGHVHIKTRGTISLSKGTGCVNCRPDYHFTIHDSYAVGRLACGTEFKVDTQFISVVKNLRLQINSKGYIMCTDSTRSGIRLHWLVMGHETQPPFAVDHINRDKTDCRSANLRFVTAQQNAMNRSIGRNSTTGYVGVCFIKPQKRYRACIGFNDKDIYLGSSRDPVECAQMYNLAAQFLFGAYRGHHNDVPPAPKHLKNQIEEKCRPYTLASLIAQTPCAIYDPA